MQKTLLALSLAGLLSANASAAPSTHDRLTALAQDMVSTDAREDPIRATILGIPGRDGKLPVPSEAARAATVARAQARVAQLDQIRRGAGASISLVDANDAPAASGRWSRRPGSSRSSRASPGARPRPPSPATRCTRAT